VEASSVSQDERREIGTLKAVGWDTADIIQVKCLESIAVGSAGTAIGIALGLAYVLAGAPGLKGFFLGWASVYPDFPLPMYVSVPGIVLLFGVGVFPLLAATVVPAWLCSIIDADEAIRS